MLSQSRGHSRALLKGIQSDPLISKDYMELRVSVANRFFPLLMAAIACLPLGCGESSETQDVTGFEDAPVDEQPEREASEFQLGGCSDGSTRSCSVTLSQHDGVLSCYYGTQLCASGKWGPCGNGEVKETPAPQESSMQLQSLGDAEACENNPCDPYCQTFQEVPDTAYEVEDAIPIFTWEEGSLSEFPSGLVKKGLQQPCDTSGDCQFNRRCKDPVNGSCKHDVCTEGDPLAPGCNDCVDMVCAADASCCQDTKGKPGGKINGVADLNIAACSHSPCSVGRGLASSCNACVSDICDLHPNCCNTGEWWKDNWSAECVTAVEEVCGNTCGCDDGQVEHDGACYAYQTTQRTWDDAKDACAGIPGGGWSLVTISDSAENDVVAGIEPSKEKYIGLQEYAGKWTWVDGASGDWDEWANSGSLYVSWAPSQPSPISGDDVDCAYMNANSNKWTGENACGSNNRKRNSVCEGPATVMKVPEGTVEVAGPREWDAQCVALAGQVCGLDCGGEPSDGSGVCSPWFPGETDPTCPGVDLAVSVPCDGVLPVCNHGNTTALPPIEVMHFPANSQQMPTCTPELTHPNMVTCIIDEPIAPGECVSISGDACKDPNGVKTPLAGNREIMINAAGKQINTGSGPVDECDCMNNWSLYSHGASECGEPSCSGGSSAAKQTNKPVDIIIIIDNSPSMGDEIQEVQARIHEDLAQILEQSKLDYRVIMISRYGDVNVPVGTSSTPICIGPPLGANACTNPSTEKLALNAPKFFHFSADIESWDSWCQLLHGFNHADEVGVNDIAAGFFSVPTPRAWTALAPSGWQEWLREDAFKTFLVISDDDIECNDYGYDFDDTPNCDGFPHNCHNLTTQTSYVSTVAAGVTAAAKFDTELLKLSPTQFGTAEKRNYVWHSIINIKNNPDGATVPWPSTADIQRDMCTPSGTQIVGAGTGYQALSKLTGGLRYPICQKQNFDAIFNEIATAVIETSAASCEFSLPEGDDADPNKAKVAYTKGTGETVTIMRVGSDTQCGTSTASWYYDDPDDPSKLTLCPETCKVVKADNEAQVWVELACPGGNEQATTFTHEYQANCPVGHLPQWTFMAYDTTTVSDGTVSFRARTANTAVELESASWHELAVASATAPDCSMAPPTGDCPIDLYEGLGKADAKKWFLQMQFTINPSSDNQSPTVEDWTVNFSCPPGE